MRREERHHLKENALAAVLARLQDALRGRGRTLAAAGVVVLAAVLGVGGYLWWQQRQADRAGELLADALLVADSEVASPDPDAAVAATGGGDGGFPSEEAKLEAAVERLLTVADAWPDLRPGVTARYEAAVRLVVLGRPEEAAGHYRRVIDVAGGQLHGTMARLGLAETHVLQGDYEEAVELLRAESEAVESDVPVDAVLMRLGRACELAGRDADALAAFTRVVEEFPFSVYSSEARRKADALGG